MVVPINITNRERICINPNNGRRIPGLTKGLVTPNLAEGGEPEKEGGGSEESALTQE